MGRRPNPIVAEFFERGKKLEDSSNRYQHTCRRCGEIFPKGRVDNLVNHLVKRCPNVTQDDRNLIMLHMQQPKKDNPVNIPSDLSGLERGQSALDTLAEVSRRHLDYSSQREAYDQQLLRDADQALVEQALWAQLQQHNMIPNQQNNDDYDLHLPLQEPLEQPFTSGDFATSAQPTSLDPQLEVPQFDAINNLANEAPATDTLQWQPTSFLPKQPRRLPPVRVKHRSRFTEGRRKQVQEMRKKGACIRCRMLKKPCSEGTPCYTCANVDSARLWKGACLRTRLVDEFTAWSSGYFGALSKRHEMPGTYSRRILNAVHIRAESDTGPGITFNAKVFHDNSFVHPDLHGAIKTLTLEDSDDLPDRIAMYLMTTSVLNDAVNAEPDHFTRTTLRQAVEQFSQESEQLLLKNDDSAQPRTCYSIANSLTQDTLELWMLTASLTAPAFEISLGEHGEAGQNIMQAQLLAAIEVRASRLSKKVLNDMERRLLQRQQVSGFATFIAAVILLSSIERMTAFYQSLDTARVNSFVPDASVDTAPRTLWTQGQSFADLLTMLLRMRGLPPRTYANDKGRLAVVTDPPDKMTKLNGSASEGQLRALDEERRGALAAWLKACKISVAEVQSWTEDGRRSWHGKFIAALLLP